jgi:hypothetical protein
MIIHLHLVLTLKTRELYLHSVYTPSLHVEGQLYRFVKEANTSTSLGYSPKQEWILEDTGYVDTVSKKSNVLTSISSGYSVK